jgi:pyruvate-formate lyase-activating enzyme
VSREGDPGADRERNVFESALGLAAIFPSEPSGKDVLRLERGFRWARRVFPVLGSLEIYTEEEWKLRTQALARSGPILDLLWRLRRLRAIESHPRRYASEPHRRKANRALRRVLASLGHVEVEEPLATENWRLLGPPFHRHIESVLQEVNVLVAPIPWDYADISVDCPYLGLLLRSRYTEDGLHVPAPLLVPLLAVIPPTQELDPATDELVERCRDEAPMKALRAAVAQFEWCVAKSRMRTHPDEQLTTWLDRLAPVFRRLIPRYDPRFFAARLRETSPTLCLAAWKQSTVNLNRGTTHSCHLAPAHAIDVEAVKVRPSALHNTDRKKRVRAEMLAGGRPADCEYCWQFERTSKQRYASDRFFKSSDPWAIDYFDEVLAEGADAETFPSYLEVSFSNRCNMKCSYCSASVSSRWQQEIEQFGAYELGGGFRHMDLEKIREEGVQFLPEGQANPFNEAFWKWWPELVKRLRVFRITGGEPLLHPDTFRVVRYFRENPQPQLELAINSNLSVPPAVVRGLLEQLSPILDAGAVKKFTLYTSADTTGAHAEYLRHGMKYGQFRQNLIETLRFHSKSNVGIMCTFNSLSVPHFRAFLEEILELRRAYCAENGERLLLGVSRLRFPDWQSIDLLDARWKQEVANIYEFMKSRARELPEYKRIGFNHEELVKVARLVDFLDKEELPPDVLAQRRARFYRFFREHDRRRKTSFEKVFPEMREFWAECARAAGETLEPLAPAESSVSVPARKVETVPSPGR